MFSQVEQLLRLLLTIPCSDAEAERSFSCLRRVKTYLRNTMGQGRLNHVAIPHVHQHQELLDTINMTQVAKKFVDKHDSRRQVLGLLKYVYRLITLQH